MSVSPRDTIFALATPRGPGALGVIRLSGPSALAIAVALAPSLRADGVSRRATVQRLWWAGRLLDEALVLPFHAPGSFTGEDVVEFHCHGGRAVLEGVLDALQDAGARPAEPGEFTRRALLNGRLDLLQAEAVAELVQAESGTARDVALAHHGGALSARLAPIREGLVELVVHVEAGIDFSLEEHVHSVDGADVVEGLAPLRTRVSELLGTWDDGRLRAEGVRVAIVGLPNAGKSSLLNHLLGEERALVSEVPGTTRDWIEEGLLLGGVAYRLVDTAGLRRTTDRVEALGISRARERVESADVALVVVDASVPGGWDREVVPVVSGRPWAVVWNKCDLLTGEGPTERAPGGALAACLVSLRTGQGVESLWGVLRLLAEAAGLGRSGDEAPITRARHRASLAEALDAMDRAAETARSGGELELIALDLRLALDAVGSLTGAVTSDDVLNRIFEGFCIGK